MADKVTWFELPADDTARAGEFYKTVFGWHVSDMGGGSLALRSVESDESLTPLHEKGVINGDISPRSEGFDKPLVVIQTDDMKIKLEAVKKAGGSVVVQPKEVEGMGMVWAIITDTEDNNVGIIQMLA